MSNNKNTAQQTGYTFNPLNKVKEAWHRFRSGFDKRQRQRNFEAHLQLQRDKFDHKKLQDQTTNKYRDNTFHFKQEKALNDYNQKERHHADKMNIAAANTDIKARNSDIFQKDAQGKNALRNASISAKQHELSKDGYTGHLTHAEYPTSTSEVDRTKKLTDQVRQNVSTKHEWQSIPKETTTSSTTSAQSVIPQVSGINPKGSKGNKKKGIQ